MNAEPAARSLSAMVFAPSPLLTVTLEPGPHHSEVHLHAGGQGFWIARMLVVLGLKAHMCAPLSGEVGTVLATLMGNEGVDVQAAAGTAGNGAYVHDRRDGERETVGHMDPQVLSRHEVDDLYGSALAFGADADISVLGGPATDDVIDPDIYRRLTADLGALGKPVIADLSGRALTAALAGGVTVIKVSHEDLIDDGRATNDDPATLIGTMHELAAEGADHVVLSRGADPTLALLKGQVFEVDGPRMQLVDHRGAGDSMTAGIAAAAAQGQDIENALRWGVAAGTSNVTRKGLASGQHQLIEQLATHITIRPLRQ